MNAAKKLPTLALLSLTRGLRQTPVDLNLVQEAAKVRDGELPKRSTVFTRDALLPDPDLVTYMRAATDATTCLARWRAAIAEARATDATVDWAQLRIDPRDGALFRLGGTPMPVTEHALQQLVSILTAGGSGPRSPAPTLAWTCAANRSMLLAELEATSKRKTSDPVVIRTALLRNDVGAGRAHPEFAREVRAIVTPRHALQHFDDAVLADRLEQLASSDAPMVLARSAHAAETRGWVEVGTAKTGLREVVSFRNSETGEARLGFWGSARITAIDELVVAPGVTTTNVTEVAFAADRHERNHTLPTVGTKELAERYGVRADGKLTEAERRSIAEQRIDESFKTARARSQELAEGWSKALKTFAPGFASDPLGALDASARAEVMMDQLTENGLVPDVVPEELLSVFRDEKRITALPWGSAAYVAAALAVLATRGTMVDGKKVVPTWQDAHKLQVAAGRWVLCGWDVKAHRASVGE